MSVPAIRFADTRFGYNDSDVLGPVSLDIVTGESLVVLGASGSGKTTMLRLINALLVPTGGVVTVLGRSTTDWDPVRLRRSTGYVIQEVGLFPHLTVARNVGLVPRLEKWATSRIEARVRELLDLVGLSGDDIAARLPHQLSGGQRQRVGFARALAHDPPLLLCDEPFGSVDPMTRAALQVEFAELARRLEKTVVFVTHDVREALRLADRVAVLDNGAMRFLGALDAFETSDDDVVRRLRAST